MVDFNCDPYHMEHSFQPLEGAIFLCETGQRSGYGGGGFQQELMVKMALGFPAGAGDEGVV